MGIDEQDRITGRQLRELREKEAQWETDREQSMKVQEYLDAWVGFFRGGQFARGVRRNLPPCPEASELEGLADRLVQLREEITALRRTLGMKED